MWPTQASIGAAMGGPTLLPTQQLRLAATCPSVIRDEGDSHDEQSDGDCDYDIVDEEEHRRRNQCHHYATRRPHRHVDHHL